MIDRKNRGAFIVIEGIDGSGKTTQARMLHDRLEQIGVPIILEKEPTSSPIGTLCRNIIEDKCEYGVGDIDSRTLSMLFAADRFDHITNSKNGLSQKLTSGNNVICDRFYLSNIVYQSYTHFYTEHCWQRIMDVLHMNDINHNELAPDLIIYVNTPPEIAINRIKERGNDLSTYEQSVSRLSQIYNTFDRAIDVLRRSWNENIVEVNGLDSVEKIHDAIYHIVYPIVNKK